MLVQYSRSKNGDHTRKSVNPNKIAASSESMNWACRSHQKAKEKKEVEETIGPP